MKTEIKAEILKLARECGGDDCVPNEPDRDGNFYMHYIELERFYRAAQAQALREAADVLRYANDRYNLIQLAEALESKI